MSEQQIQQLVHKLVELEQTYLEITKNGKSL